MENTMRELTATEPDAVAGGGPAELVYLTVNPATPYSTSLIICRQREHAQNQSAEYSPYAHQLLTLRPGASDRPCAKRQSWLLQQKRKEHEIRFCYSRSLGCGSFVHVGHGTCRRMPRRDASLRRYGQPSCRRWLRLTFDQSEADGPWQACPPLRQSSRGAEIMTYVPYPHNVPAYNPHLNLGPRTRHEVELRVRELKGRLHPTVKDHAELARLRDLLGKGGNEQ
jgi:hypothetical protein